MLSVVTGLPGKTELKSSKPELLELLQIKNRQMNITNLRLMKNQAVTKAIQMFPPPFY